MTAETDVCPACGADMEDDSTAGICPACGADNTDDACQTEDDHQAHLIAERRAAYGVVVTMIEPGTPEWDASEVALEAQRRRGE